jgi:hypothetical protein
MMRATRKDRNWEDYDSVFYTSLKVLLFASGTATIIPISIINNVIAPSFSSPIPSWKAVLFGNVQKM